MRILHLIHVRWWNASAQYAVHLAAAQRASGHDVTVYTAAGQPPAAHAKALGLTVIERPLDWRHSAGMYGELAKLGKQFDVVNAHHADVQNIALAALRGPVRPLLVRTRVDVRDAKPSAMNKYLYNRRLDMVIVPGEDSRRRYIERLGIAPGQVATVYGGIDHNRFRPDAAIRASVRKRLGIEDDQIVFGMVGRLGTVKGPEVFIEAAAQLSSRYPQAVFLAAGRAASVHSVEEYSALAAKMSSPVRFLGHVDDAAELMAALDAGVICSVGSEAHCRVGLEMMSSGLPVVGTDIGVIPEVVADGETGYIVRSRSVPELASRLEKLVLDGAQRRALGRQARERVESRYTFAHWVAATEAAYRRAGLRRA